MARIRCWADRFFGNHHHWREDHCSLLASHPYQVGNWLHNAFHQNLLKVYPTTLWSSVGSSICCNKSKIKSFFLCCKISSLIAKLTIPSAPFTLALVLQNHTGTPLHCGNISPVYHCTSSAVVVNAHCNFFLRGCKDKFALNWLLGGT